LTVHSSISEDYIQRSMHWIFDNERLSDIYNAALYKQALNVTVRLT